LLEKANPAFLASIITDSTSFLKGVIISKKSDSKNFAG
jgi:hypothetical protein